MDSSSVVAESDTRVQTPLSLESDGGSESSEHEEVSSSATLSSSVGEPPTGIVDRKCSYSLE